MQPIKNIFRLLENERIYASDNDRKRLTKDWNKYCSKKPNPKIRFSVKNNGRYADVKIAFYSREGDLYNIKIYNMICS